MRCAVEVVCAVLRELHFSLVCVFPADFLPVFRERARVSPS